MNYYLNVSLVGLSTKYDRCQDVTHVNRDFHIASSLILQSSFFEKVYFSILASS